MNNVREVERINERELELALEGKASWHDEYRDSAYIFVGNLDKRLTEGDVIAVFSQYGEVLDINMPREKEGGAGQEQRASSSSSASKPGDRRGFGFLLYEDQRSTVLAVDNLNGYSLLNRTLRVDHVKDYKMPKRRNEEGDMEEAQEPSRNAAPQVPDAHQDQRRAETDDGASDDADDPMAAYISRSKGEKEERRKRKEERDRRRLERHERREKRKERRDRSPVDQEARKRSRDHR